MREKIVWQYGGCRLLDGYKIKFALIWKIMYCIDGETGVWWEQSSSLHDLGRNKNKDGWAGACQRMGNLSVYNTEGQVKSLLIQSVEED